MILGYAFWFVISRFSTPQVVGTSSAIISFATILVNVATIGIPLGIERYLGRSFSEKRTADAKNYVTASTILVSIGLVSTSTVILILRDEMQNIFKVDSNLMLLAIIVLCSTSFYNLFRSVLISAIRTKSLPIVGSISAASRISIGLILILVGWGATGVTVAYGIAAILGAVLFVRTAMMNFRGANGSQFSFRTISKDIWSASAANWIPALIAAIASQLGTIVVFASNGPDQAGVYFIVYSIVTAISALASVLFTIAFPALSSMDDGRKVFVWRIIKMSGIIALPLSACVFFYSRQILQLFGTSYDQGSLVMQIMLLAILPGQLASGVSTLSYSYGKYRQVLIINLTGNVIRIALFVILTPMMGTSGAAMSYTLGAVGMLVVSVFVSSSIGFKIFWKTSLLTFAVPFSIAFIQSYLGLYYVAGITFTLVVSYLAFIKLRIITQRDMEDSLGVLPGSVSRSTLNVLNKIGRKLDRSY